MSESMQGENEIEDPLKMVGIERHVTRDLKGLHGIKSVVQETSDYCLVVTAYDDYPLLSNVQTVCAWNAATFTVESAGRVDGDIVARISVHE